MKYAYSRKQTAVAWLIYKLQTCYMLKDLESEKLWNDLKKEALRMESHDMLDAGSYFHSQKGKKYETVNDFFKEFYEFYNTRYYNDDNVGPDYSLSKLEDIWKNIK